MLGILYNTFSVSRTTYTYSELKLIFCLFVILSSPYKIAYLMIAYICTYEYIYSPTKAAKTIAYRNIHTQI